MGSMNRRDDYSNLISVFKLFKHTCKPVLLTVLINESSGNLMVITELSTVFPLIKKHQNKLYNGSISEETRQIYFI